MLKFSFIILRINEVYFVHLILILLIQADLLVSLIFFISLQICKTDIYHSYNYCPLMKNSFSGINSLLNLAMFKETNK